MLPELSCAVAADAMRVHGEQLSLKISTGPAQLAQRHLQADGLRHGMFRQQQMDRGIPGHKRQTRGQFETAAIGESPVGTNPRRTQHRLVDQLQGQPRLDAFRGILIMASLDFSVWRFSPAAQN